MDGLMMDFQLTIPTCCGARRRTSAQKEIVTRLPDKSFHRYTYADMARRAKQLAVALAELGLERGDRVATLCWNHHQHLEAYFGIPCGGFVLHTLNLRLHPNDLGYIANHAGDRALIVDARCCRCSSSSATRRRSSTCSSSRTRTRSCSPAPIRDDWVEPELDENEAAGDVLHERHDRHAEGRRLLAPLDVLHTLGVGAANPLGSDVASDDAILPVVPMFHANAWGYPYLAAMLGAKLVFPGPHLDPESLLEDFVQESASRGGRRADDLARRSCSCSTRARHAGTCRA